MADSDELTPPPYDLDELVRRLWPVRKFADQLLEVEQRVSVLEDRPDETTERVNKLETDIVDIKGSSGANGKLGALRERFDKTESRRWWLMTFAAGSLITVLGIAIAFGRWMGTIESDVAAIKSRLDKRMERGRLDQPDAHTKGATP